MRNSLSYPPHNKSYSFITHSRFSPPSKFFTASIVLVLFKRLGLFKVVFHKCFFLPRFYSPNPVFLFTLFHCWLFFFFSWCKLEATDSMLFSGKVSSRNRVDLLKSGQRERNRVCLYPFYCFSYFFPLMSKLYELVRPPAL